LALITSCPNMQPRGPRNIVPVRKETLKLPEAWSTRRMMPQIALSPEPVHVIGQLMGYSIELASINS
jgi:hypothetical protein